MQLTNTGKLLIYTAAILVSGATLIWTGIKVDVLGLGLREEWFNIGLVVLTTLGLMKDAALGVLGLKAPTVESRREGE